MPNGTTGCGGDTAPAQSPVQVLGLSLVAGESLTFSATGSVHYSGASPSHPPDGVGSAESFYNTEPPASHGIASLIAPANSLIGLFLDNRQPDSSAAPSGLNFTGGGGLGLAFASLSPGLRQTFFIGDGLTGNGSGSIQTFVVPAGATRLFLGSVDGSGWANNSGSFDVSVVAPTPAGGGNEVPEPSTFGLMGTAIGLLLVSRYARLQP